MLVHPKPGALVWPAAMVVWGPGFTTAGHRHHCVQLVMAMRGTLLIRRRPSDPWIRCGAALVRPDAEHEVDAQNTIVLIGFVESESELGAALAERIEGHISSVSDVEVARWRVALGRMPSEARAERWVRTQLLHKRRPVRIHPGVTLVLKHLREKLGIADDFSLKTLASISGLSQSRFMHVFTESTGVPLRPYVLWLRLQRACCDLMSGASVTAAAHAAGFSDAAHLTRTFRRMLGMTPTDLALRKRMSRGVTLDRVDSQRDRINPTPTVRVVAATRTAPV
jgi:AraC-like DNA-binding protein